MRLTEALHYYNMSKAPSVSWMRMRFAHFSPTVDDEKAREEFQKRLLLKSLQKQQGSVKKKVFFE